MKGVVVTVNAKKGLRRLQDLKRTLKSESHKLTKSVTKQAFNYARAVMPKYTQQTYEAMDYEIKPQLEGVQGTILVRDVPRGDVNMAGKVLTAQDLVLIMESGKWGKFHPPWSGNPRFMTATSNYLNSIAKQRFGKELKYKIKGV